MNGSTAMAERAALPATLPTDQLPAQRHRVKLAAVLGIVVLAGACSAANLAPVRVGSIRFSQQNYCCYI